MKTLILIISIFAIAGCTYTYGTKQTKGGGKSSLIIFDNQIKMSEIDGEKFSSKFSVWKDGTHKLYLEPGKHTFKFKYSDVSMSGGGVYTKEDSVLSSVLEAGKVYKIGHSYSGNQLLFEIYQKYDESI